MDTETIKDEADIAGSMKAMAHPVRVRILRLLNERENRGMTVREIQKHLGLTQPETSRHLLIMKMHHILSHAKKGSSVFYGLNRENSFSVYLATYLKGRARSRNEKEK
ncbi:MAG: metalloregulator ArsR/SmtB family transcription factor [Bacteroidota bacterium]